MGTCRAGARRSGSRVEPANSVGGRRPSRSITDLAPILELAVGAELKLKVFAAGRRGHTRADAHAHSTVRAEGAGADAEAERHARAAAQDPLGHAPVVRFADDCRL